MASLTKPVKPSALHDALAGIDGLEIIAPPQLSTLAFALRPAAREPVDDVNARTRTLLGHINDDRRVLVTGTMLRGRFVIRPSIVAFRTHAAAIDTLIERIRDGT